MQSIIPIALNECKENIQKNIVDIYGWSGSVSVITAYALTTLKIDQLLLIDILNLYGSLAIGYICYRKQVWQALVCEITWFGIGSYSITHRVLSGDNNIDCHGSPT
jgi:hypothetical protein